MQIEGWCDMYTLLVNNNNEIITTVKERIMQRSKLVDNLHFLVEPTYKEHDMSSFTVLCEYLSPVSREYQTEILVQSDTLYKEKLEFKLPFDTKLTKEAGSIELQLTFLKVDMDADGQVMQRVRKAGPATITIIPVTAWSNAIVDSSLTALDQRLIMAETMINAANDMVNYLDETKADNIIRNEEDNTIQLTANGKPIGNKIECSNSSGYGVVNVVIDENNNLIVTFTDGQVINAGRVSNSDGVTFTPHVSDDYILSWTNDGGLQNPEPVDLYPHDEWIELNEGPETPTEYTWEFI